MSEMVLLSITIYAMAIVISFLVAALIKGIVFGLPMLNRTEAAPATPAPGPATAAAVPPEHVAAIAGVVAAVMGPQHIIHIEDPGRTKLWTAEGRLIHQTSHSVTRTRKN